eukprot:TRINITY_DN4223_c0_g1_i7.p1 TRINITY_DN4223_c0_g1~~TRINITY_DN4223_c0_g1_i7.p1  ORF type:complete len:263 (-),score=40.12 TRINITY_DN4223_c0_g1_i7:236-1024(-)
MFVYFLTILAVLTLQFTCQPTTGVSKDVGLSSPKVGTSKDVGLAPGTPTPTPSVPPTAASTLAPAPITPTLTPTGGQCPLYDSRSSQEFDTLERCKVNANGKSQSGEFACELAQDIVRLLAACTDKATFEAEFISLVQQKFKSFVSLDGWGIYGAGVAFEPFTFENVELYIPYHDNEDVAGSGEFSDLIDSYNYYTECLSTFGDGCTWYHQAKLTTYFRGTGGLWTNRRFFDGFDKPIWSFYAPVILNGRYYGVVAADVLEG